MTKTCGTCEPDYVAERKLPDGKTCADCQHGNICDGLFGAVSKGFRSCDFWPSRFRENQMQESNVIDDYKDGWKSAEIGLSRCSPYPVFSREYKNWCAGWDAYHAENTQ